MEKVFNFADNDFDVLEKDLPIETKILIDLYKDSDDPAKGNSVVIIDIEVDSIGGFPNVNTADKQITAISLYERLTNKYTSLVLDIENKITNTETNTHILKSYPTERDLLKDFIDIWQTIHPDIVSGWNCIPLNQSVWKQDKIIKMENVVKDDKLYDSNVLQKFPISVKEKWCIELCNGLKIYSSGDHKFPVKVVNPDEYITFNETKKSNFFDINLKTRQISSFTDKIDLYIQLVLRINQNNDNIKYNNNQLYLAGLIYTDGTLKNKHKIGGCGYTFYQSDLEFIQGLLDVGVKSIPYGPYKNCYSVTITKKEIGDAHYLIYTDKNEKKLNLEELSTLSYVQFMSFLSGLLDGDGCKDTNTIQWCNFNNDLDILHELCNWNGIFCTQTKYHLRFIDINWNDLSLRKIKRWGGQKRFKLERISKQKSDQIRFKKIGNDYWVKVKKVDYIGTSTRMSDIHTNTNYFISKGIKTHNCNWFDIPYLVRRIDVVLGENKSNQLSPIGVCFYNKRLERMIIGCVNCLDYLVLYKKFRFEPRPTYNLDYIGNLEVKQGKIKYTGSLNQLYKDDIKKYIDYNLCDVEIVKKLDDKFKFIDLAIGICHSGHVPYEWFNMSSRFIEGAIITYMRNHGNMVAPNKPISISNYEDSLVLDEDSIDDDDSDDENTNKSDEKFRGAYVKEPIPGLYDWIVNCDVQSLYPSLIRTINISTETYIGKVENWSVTEYIKGNLNEIKIGQTNYTIDEFKNLLNNEKVSIACNGALYETKNRGIIPCILDIWFAKRVGYKNLAKKHKNENNMELYSYYDRLQHIQKIFLNSFFGIIGLNSGRFFSLDNAEAITISGQEVIKTTEKVIISYFKDKFKQYDKEYLNESITITYGDTDSVAGNSQLKLIDGSNISIDNFFNKIKNEKENEYAIDFSNREYVFPLNEKLLYFNEKDKKIDFGKVKYIEKHLVKKRMFRIKTKNGKFIKVTEDHSLMVLVNGKLIEKKPIELKKRDKIISIF